MSASGQNNVDLDALLDLTEYDGLQSQSPSLSPGNTKANYASPVSAVTSTPSIPSTSTQTLSGPSHNYDMYRQQTGFVPGALANTMAVNQTNNTGYQDFGSLDYLSNMSPEHDIFDFSTTPPQTAMPATEMEVDFNSAADSQEYFSTINPNNIEHETSLSPATSSQSSVGRLWPGAHSQAAQAKTQTQQRPQPQMMPQQQQHAQPRQPSQQPQKARAKGSPPTDPLVEQKITQLLNSMRAKPPSPDDLQGFANGNLPKAKKEEDEMDEDERLLASEEGKKLSSKERRQLRNKVSARAFRSRRKEYITQLESEIASKVNENGELRAQNRALLDENKRLTDLTRMLLSSPSFSNFLDNLSANPSTIPAPPARLGALQPQQPQQQPQQQQQQRQMAKDVSPYDAPQSQQQIGMAMIPEQTMDFSMLSLGNNPYSSYQPQVFVVDTPEVPSIDTAVLSGKSSNFVEPTLDSEDNKVEMPAIERLLERAEPTAIMSTPVDEEFDADPEFALFHSEPTPVTKTAKELDTDSLNNVDIFGGIESDKILARYEMVDASEDETCAMIAMARVQRISDNIESVVSRLELLTMGL